VFPSCTRLDIELEEKDGGQKEGTIQNPLEWEEAGCSGQHLEHFGASKASLSVGQQPKGGATEESAANGMWVFDGSALEMDKRQDAEGDCAL
jgi:hypothetical protein